LLHIVTSLPFSCSLVIIYSLIASKSMMGFVQNRAEFSGFELVVLVSGECGTIVPSGTWWSTIGPFSLSNTTKNILWIRGNPWNSIQLRCVALQMSLIKRHSSTHWHYVLWLLRRTGGFERDKMNVYQKILETISHQTQCLAFIVLEIFRWKHVK
jgi:hypothetical protein